MQISNSLGKVRVKKALFLAFLFSGLILLPACSILGIGGGQSSEPVYGSEAGIPKSQILYSDDFSRQNGGWTTTESPSGSKVAYAHQGLEFLIHDVERDYWSTRDADYGDVGVGVDASKLGGPDDNTFGVICRFQDEKNFYAFLISSDGYYGIVKVKNGNYALLSGKNMDYSAGIVRGSGTNRVLGVCAEDYLGLFVNGQLMTIVQDGDFARGKTGLIAGANSIPGTDILFDNLIIYQQ